jgi:hypothetical protein
MDFWEQYQKCPEIGYVRREIEQSCIVPNHPFGWALEKIQSNAFSDFFWKLLTDPEMPKDITGAVDILENLDRTTEEILRLKWVGVD